MSIVFVLESSEVSPALVHELMACYPVLRVEGMADLNLCRQKFPASFLHSVLLCGCETSDYHCQSLAKLDIPTVHLCRHSKCEWTGLGSSEGKSRSYHLFQSQPDQISETLVQLINKMTHCRSMGAQSLRFAGLSLDTLHGHLRVFEVSDDCIEILTALECRILAVLMQHHEQCVSRQKIKGAVWSRTTVNERSLDSHISRLRKRLEGSGTMIESVYGEGYILKRAGSANF